MPDIKNINVDDVLYDIKDETARAQIGDIAALKTTAKDSLVNAINELKTTTPTGDSNNSDCLPTVTDDDNGKVLKVVDGEWTADTLPVFDLAAMGMSPIAFPGNGFVETDTTEIVAALDVGSVRFAIPVILGGSEMTAYLTTQGFTDGTGFYQCVSTILNDCLYSVVLIVADGAVMVQSASVSAFIGFPDVTTEDNGKILQVVDGAWSTVTPEFDGAGTADCDLPDSTVSDNGKVLQVVNGEPTWQTLTFEEPEPELPAVTNTDNGKVLQVVNGQPKWETIESSGSAESDLPAVTAADNDKFLRVVNGAWAAVSVSIAEEASF